MGSQSTARPPFFLRPLATAVPGLHVECALMSGRFEVRSGAEGDTASLVDAEAHCSGACGGAAHEELPRVDHASARGRHFARAVDVAALYGALHAAGLQYGPGYRTLEQVWRGSGPRGIEARGGGAPAGECCSSHEHIRRWTADFCAASSSK